MTRTGKKSPLMEWIDEQLDRDPRFRRKVEEQLNELEIEQDLVALREARGLSQAQLARMLGVSQPAIAKIESGRAKNLQLRTLVRIVAALGGQIKIVITKSRQQASKVVALRA